MKGQPFMHKYHNKHRNNMIMGITTYIHALVRKIYQSHEDLHIQRTSESN